jgi:cytochrome c oxidase subunit 3
VTPTTAPTLERKHTGPPRGPATPGWDRGFGPDRDRDGGSQRVPPSRIAVWLVVATVTLLFAAFTSTYLARRAEPDWQRLQMPGILWLNTAVLAISSVLVEWSRRAGLRLLLSRLRAGIMMATALGVVFLGGQIVAWRQLAATGIFLASSPHSSFFYLLTGAHGLHILGGLLALFYAVGKTRTAGSVEAVVEPIGTFWHFLGVLWLYLLVLLFWI